MGVLPERGREALHRTREELDRLRQEGPSEEEVAAARRQLKGIVVMDNESISTRMIQLAHEEIYRGQYATMEQQIDRILRVTREQVAEAARLYLGPARGGPITEADWVGVG